MALNVPLIFSRHEESGFCTSDVLLQIIERVNPEVIFEELSSSLHHEAYVDKTLNNLESLAIIKYLTDHDVIHIPVDTYDLAKDYYKNLDYMYDALVNSAGEHSFHFRNFLDRQASLGNRRGFSLFNSNQNDKLFEEMSILKERALEALDKENLHQIARLEKYVVEKREDVMLDNIYKYSKENKYAKGLMFIGSGHRKSIMKKIEERKKTEDIKIDWRYFSDLITASL